MNLEKSVKKFDANAEYFFREGCYIAEIANSINNADISIARARE